MTITIAILAGGQSKRMGTDKALLDVDGVPLLTRIAGEALATGRRVVVVGRQRPADWPHTDVHFVKDPAGGNGPIGGLSAALTFAREPVLLLACDMPGLTRRSITWLLEEAQGRQPSWGLAVRNGTQLEPLFSFYMPAILAIVDQRIGQGRRSLLGLFEVADIGYVDAPDDLRPELVNVNTAEEWKRFRGLA